MDSIENDEDDAIVGVTATSVLAVGAAIILSYENQSNIPRAPYTNKDQERKFYINSILNGSNVHCFRKIESHFYRLIESVHRCFHIVFQAILKLYPTLVKSPNDIIQKEIRNNHRYYPWFADRVGSIDFTHVLASVPIEHQNRYRSRKGTTTQNVLAAVNFNLTFTYVLAGWEGYAHDARILNDALERPRGFQVPQDKYYRLDARYSLRKGFIRMT
ncbi:uncharacterized protein LOC142175171 [Nicotiana tabacum]|uniref:Uncharacterized protein LOC142175171 n=1 Tax=Nicotiana tabacum TaxID=4097 RepID=A0AC58TKU4_TOBAC